MRAWVTAAALGVGLALLAAAVALARPASTSGGTLRINLVSDTDYVDPALSYYGVGWELLYATCLKLLNYPDAEAPEGSQLGPEAAVAMPRVSKDGRTYTFELRRGLRSNLGNELTAASFARAIGRALNPRMQSAGAAFIRDIVGAKDVTDGKTVRAAGISTRGRYVLRIRTTKPAPDLPARIAMPFFCAVPPDLKIEPEGVNQLESWGPYYVAERVPYRSILLRRNPNYRGPRPHHLDAIAYRAGVNQETSLKEIESGAADYAGDGLARDVYGKLASRYGVNKRRFFAKPILGIRYLRLNLTRPLFNDNPKLARAVAFAVDRPEFVRKFGAFAGRRTDQLLPNGMPGFRDADLYPLKGSDYETARRLARGATRDGKARLYTCSTTACFESAQVLRYNLGQIGIAAEVVICGRHCGGLDGVDCDEPFDLYLTSWFADYADPSTFLVPPPPRPGFVDTGPPMWCNLSSDYAARYAEANTSPDRLRALSSLEIETLREAPPVIPLSLINDRFFVSARTRNVVYNPVYGLDLAALRVR